MYRTGVTGDYNESIKWYNRAASEGSRAAQNCLDQLHSQEKINSDGEALSNLGYYKNPVGGRRLNSLLRKHISYINHAQKENQLQRLAMSAMKRDINAMYEIGIKYQDGDDLPQDDDLSLKWIKRPARGGLEKAQLIMGEMYKEGKLIEQNYHKASVWYKKRPLRKSDVFQYNLGMLYFDGYGV
jgi:TPR repeat protein